MSGALAISRPIDWSSAAAWTTLIVDEQLEPVRHAFRENGAQGPEVAWSPGPSEAYAPPIAALLDYWSSLLDGAALPPADRIDPLRMRRALGYVLLIDVVDDGRDFRYRLFGSAVAAVSGFDMTGKLLSEHGASAYLREFSLALYRAAMQRRESVFCTYAPSGTVTTVCWQRLALPLTDQSGAVTRFLAGSVPIGRNGRVVTVRI
ncbi:MAG TPA: PAS domain-containing protein [Alphaproteobacteria bacterium]|nr:PAS domain-containing protein [Alphaproteobacteria bacterium]